MKIHLLSFLFLCFILLPYPGSGQSVDPNGQAKMENFTIDKPFELNLTFDFKNYRHYFLSIEEALKLF